MGCGNVDEKKEHVGSYALPTAPSLRGRQRTASMVIGRGSVRLKRESFAEAGSTSTWLFSLRYTGPAMPVIRLLPVDFAPAMTRDVEGGRDFSAVERVLWLSSPKLMALVELQKQYITPGPPSQFSIR